MSRIIRQQLLESMITTSVAEQAPTVSSILESAVPALNLHNLVFTQYEKGTNQELWDQTTGLN